MPSEMKASTLQPTVDVDLRQLTGGRSLSSNYVPLCLENKFLKETPSLVPPPPPLLQPSTLSSSWLLSTSHTPSSLISTENKLLKKDASSALATSISFPTSSLSTSRFCHPPSFLGAEQQTPDEADGGEDEEPASESSWALSPSSDGETSEEEESASSMELTVQDVHELEDLDPGMVSRSEEFAEMDGGAQEIVANLKDQKYHLLNVVCCSLVNKSVDPGAEEWDEEKSVWTRIINLVKGISESDPQFVLKVAVYTRQELNIRITANFLLALAANLPATKSHVRRYICAAIQLPSDWLEVVRIYSKCFSKSLPMCLKKGLTDKFKQFKEYQLAKYNTRKHRGKHSAKPKEKPSAEQVKKWADLLRSEPAILEKYLQSKKRQVVDKKQAEFSLKKMIRTLHIKEPADHVMAILGRKYPADAKAFTHSGLKGQWDHERAGQRMKLKEPETWERLLSREGNNAATWERLIDNNSLPFMAMLRNLRNMITQGISETHHQKIIGRLTNKNAVIQSRQFPLRFLAAYKVMMELRSVAVEAAQDIPSVTKIMTSILKKIPRSKRYQNLEWDETKRCRKRVTMGVPFIYQMYRTKRAQLFKANRRRFTVEVLDRYCAALETSVQISCRYNIPPLPGRTVIMLNSHWSDTDKWLNNLDFYIPPDPNAEEPKMEEEMEEEEEEEKKNEEQEEEEKENEEENEEEENEEEKEEEENEEEKEEEEDEEEKEKKRKRNKRRKRNEEKRDKLAPSGREVASLLALMLASCCEDANIFIYYSSRKFKVTLKSDVLLENVRSVVKRMEEARNAPYDEYNKDVSIFPRNGKVDNVILMNEGWTPNDQTWKVDNYRKEVNKKTLLVKIFLTDHYYGDDRSHDPQTVELVGFSEQTLRFVAERGSSRLLDHVEYMDKLHKVPPQQGTVETTKVDKVSIPASPKIRWRTVRVFVSSTFRDMHAERDVLVRNVFPELRRLAAPHCLHVQEVELRWGVTEEESARAAEMCLSQVCRSQMMVVILGERYGLAPPKPALPDRPECSWLASAPDGLSVTELEVRQFQALHGDAERMFCYFRDPEISKSVPVAWKSDFSPESKEAQSKMQSLKEMIQKSKAKVTNNYSCEWAGVVEGKPYLKHLEDFGKAVLQDLWAGIVKHFVKESDEVASDVLEQRVHQAALQAQCTGRSKQLLKAAATVKQTLANGGMMLVEGRQGEGKSVFTAALESSPGNFDTIFYSTAASQSAPSAGHMLRYLVRSLRELQESEDEHPPTLVYRDLLSEFHTTLKDRKEKKPLVLVVDGVDKVVDAHGQISSEWIPQNLPKNVCLVLSATSNAALVQTLAKRKHAVLFSLGPLMIRDRLDIVKKQLDDFGKKLSDTAFNNQLQTLVLKKGAISPLYLRLACEHLKNFASFDTLNQNLQDLPDFLGQLVQVSLERLCSQHRAVEGLRWTLSALTVSSAGLRETELYSLLNVSGGMIGGADRVQKLKLNNRLPMATFTQIVLSLRSLIDPSRCCHEDDPLKPTHPEVKQAFEDFFLPTEGDRTRAHHLLGVHLWMVADTEGKETFLHAEAAAVQQLPTSLIASGQLEPLASLLSNFYFLHANVRHNLLHQLLQTYSHYDDLAKTKSHTSDYQVSLEGCRRFLQRNAALLPSWPALFVQQALNEPVKSAAHVWAKRLKVSQRAVEWNNNDSQEKSSSTLVTTFPDDPTCLVASPDGQMMVVSSAQGTLHLVHTHTGQEVKSLVSGCDGVSSCAFLSDGRLAVTSFDGRIEIWDVENGCKTALIDGHKNSITASSGTADRKHLATVSLDFTLKVWSSDKGHQVASWPSTSPLNCVTFDPEDRLLAAGCWSGQVLVWNWLQNQSQAILRGHRSSVRSVSFSPSSSSMLCSGSLSGEVRLWSVPPSTCVGCFQAHWDATEALTFLDDGAKLLTAGSDCRLQLWSGGLGRSIVTMKDEKVQEEQQPPRKKKKSESEEAALCVAARGDYVAVGYHGNGFRLFSRDSGELVWAPDCLNLTVYSLLWICVDVEETTVELLLTAGADTRLRLWKRTDDGGMTEAGLFAGQVKPVRAMAHNKTYLATGSDDCSVLLWLLSEIAVDNCSDPHDLLKGHSGPVTCLTFSPDGTQLLTGARDKALVFWDVSSTPAVQSRTIPHAHRDWITGCVWTPDCVVSSSNDGQIILWDATEDKRLKVFTWSSPLTSICCQGPYLLAGCSEGSLHMWNWEKNMEICHIPAHKQRINQISILPGDDAPEDLKVVTASDDGAARLWSPMQVEHFGSLLGHSGGVSGVLLKSGVPEFLSISEDGSLRSWTWDSGNGSGLQGSVTALCFSPGHDLVLVGYGSGLLELWRNNKRVGQKQAASVDVTAVCVMDDGNFAVGYKKSSVDIWRLEWRQERACLLKVATHAVDDNVAHLIPCNGLIAVSVFGQFYNVFGDHKDWRNRDNHWEQSVRVLDVRRSDRRSAWLIGEDKTNVQVGFLFSVGHGETFSLKFSDLNLFERSRDEGKLADTTTAGAQEEDFFVLGDLTGNMRSSKGPQFSSWSDRKLVHSDRITALRLTRTTIVSASADRTVKIWDRTTMKQLGMFVCEGPVLVLELDPVNPCKMVCGDALGNVYFLSWLE